jgi:hypothetical protein
MKTCILLLLLIPVFSGCINKSIPSSLAGFPAHPNRKWVKVGGDGAIYIWRLGGDGEQVYAITDRDMLVSIYSGNRVKLYNRGAAYAQLLAGDVQRPMVNLFKDGSSEETARKFILTDGAWLEERAEGTASGQLPPPPSPPASR